METPTLETKRLTLRPITPNDIDFIYELTRRGETNLYSAYDDLTSRGDVEKMYEGRARSGLRGA